MSLAAEKLRLSDLDATIEGLDKRIADARASDIVEIERQRALVGERERAWRTMQAIVKSALA